jgi:DNA-directed RNA polymerase subunit RPC12/RpoP
MKIYNLRRPFLKDFLPVLKQIWYAHILHHKWDLPVLKTLHAFSYDYIECTYCWDSLKSYDYIECTYCWDSLKSYDYIECTYCWDSRMYILLGQ